MLGDVNMFIFIYPISMDCTEAKCVHMAGMMDFESEIARITEFNES